MLTLAIRPIFDVTPARYAAAVKPLSWKAFRITPPGFAFELSSVLPQKK